MKASGRAVALGLLLSAAVSPGMAVAGDPAAGAIPAGGPQPATGAGLVAATADSDDLIAAPARGTGAAAAAIAQSPAAVAAPAAPAAQPGQVASAPSAAVPLAAVPAAAAPLASVTEKNGAVTAVLTPASGLSGVPEQVAQVELVPPPPIGGYQRPVSPTPYAPTDTLETDINRSLAIIEAQSNPMLIGGLAFRAHSGDNGLNRLNEAGIPIEGSFSPWYTGTIRMSVLPVWLNANGSVSSGDLGSFGANPLLVAHGLPLVGSGSESYFGVGLLGGYAYGDFSGQIGTSPLGFPVTNLVGNVAYAPKFLDDNLTVRIEGLRQPVTDSVLSYAGTHAGVGAANAAVPGAFVTNGTWGGVVKTGGHVTAFYDDQMYGAYAGAGYAELTGTSVAENSAIDALLGAYFRPWKTDNWAIRTGISAYYASYDKNLYGFTFGQGGYFSPQNYIALTFPVEYTGHEGQWSWLASAALGVQHFNSDRSPIFPISPGAQLALETTPGGVAFFSGTTDTGPAFNVKGQIEYAIDDTLSVGAAASLDNGNNYTEGIAKLYLRKTFDWFGPTATKSDPQSIVGRDQPMSRL